MAKSAPPPDIVVPEPHAKDFAASSAPFKSVPMPQSADTPKSFDSDTTATNSSDEFDWDEDEAEHEAEFEASKAKRLRAVYLGFMKLSRTIRTLLVAILGCAILITPLIVVEVRFNNNAVHNHIFTWSLWLAIIWATSCATSLLLDMAPRMVIGLIVLGGGQVERFKFQLEVRGTHAHAYSRADQSSS